MEARRGASEINPNSNTQLGITLLPVNNASGYPNNGYHGGNVNDVPVQHKSFKYPSNYPNATCSAAVNYQSSSFTAPQSYTVNAQDVMLDILDGYLGMESASLHQSREKPHGTPNPVSIQNFYSVFKPSVQFDCWFIHFLSLSFRAPSRVRVFTLIRTGGISGQWLAG